MRTTSQVCYYCKVDFQLPAKYETAQKKKGRTHFFCSRSCSAIYGNKTSKRIPPKPQYGNKHNKKGDFTLYLTRTNYRGKEFDLDEEYLSSIWNDKCAITGIPIEKKVWGSKSKPTTASLDRIDSAKGYIKGNVQFVAYSVNLAKNNFPEDVIKGFFDLLRQ